MIFLVLLILQKKNTNYKNNIYLLRSYVPNPPYSPDLPLWWLPLCCKTKRKFYWDITFDISLLFISIKYLTSIINICIWKTPELRINIIFLHTISSCPHQCPNKMAFSLESFGRKACKKQHIIHYISGMYALHAKSPSHPGHKSQQRPKAWLISHDSNDISVRRHKTSFARRILLARTLSYRIWVHREEGVDGGDLQQKRNFDRADLSSVGVVLTCVLVRAPQSSRLNVRHGRHINICP